MAHERPAAERIWLMAGDVPAGPFDVAQVHAKLEAGEVSWETLGCPLGAGQWTPLVKLPGFGPAAAAPPPPAPAPPGSWTPPAGRPAPAPSAAAATTAGVATSSPAAPSPPRPWNPTTIGWLGLLFSPTWAGVMAALNGRRLGSPIRAGVPLAIGFGALGLDVLIGQFTNIYLVDVALYLGGLMLLWWLVLGPQQALFDAPPGPRAGATAPWTWPVVAGAPLALLVFLAFVVAPLMPLEPRQVCEKFLAAATAAEARQYATLNLAAAIDAMYAQKDQGDPASFELTDEAAASPEVGGYFVGFRSVASAAGRSDQTEGVFHLVDFAGAWKIEDLYFTTFNRQPIDPWGRLSTDYVAMFGPAARPAFAPTAPGSGAGPPAARPAWYKHPAAQRTMGLGLRGLIYSGGLKKAFLALAALGGGLAAWARKASAGPVERADGRAV